uniref:Uncharacterized protein n=1 Tax=Strombidium rassoulzadegani TaxID=1082188 RepID=A0A7S3FUH1_9SPIT|mmetsp:Transcript_16057/g.27080  ORF Transcript_16057/g.27080 Transcript_16057/m.27080 type:complete len:239 (+) Transcript_16057:641-1357(+)
MFLDLDAEEINKRLGQDLQKYNFYFLGITLALTSSALDVVTYYIIRKVGMKIPSQIIPFISGTFTSTAIIIFCLFTQPFDFGYFVRDICEASYPELSQEQLGELTMERERYKEAVMLACVGCVGGWIAIECMIMGLRISKSALASYAEQVGIVVPFTFDTFILQRDFLKTDGVGLSLIVILQGYQAYRSTIQSKGEIKNESSQPAPDDLIQSESLLPKETATTSTSVNQDYQEDFKKQ